MSGGRYRYAAFGTAIASDGPLPDLPPAAAGAPVELTIVCAPWEGDRPAAAADAVIGPETLWRLSDGARLLRHDHPGMDAAWTLRVAADGRRLEVRCDRAPRDDVAQVVQGAGVGACLARMRRPVLHACAVAAGGRALILSGASGAGKSTLAAAFVAAGHAVLADDLAVLDRDLDGQVVVHPGAPRLRLAPRSARAAGWDPDALAPVFRSGLGDKLRVPLTPHDGTFCGEPRPVAAICVLGERSAELAIEQVPAAAAVPLLVEGTYAARVLDAGDRAALFLRYAEVAAQVPVLRVSPPAGLERVGELVEALATRAAG